LELSELLFDEAAQRDGAWVRFEGDVELRIASSSTREYEEAVRAALEPHLLAQRNGGLDADVGRSIDVKLAARLLLRDWRGVTRDGAPLPYTPEIGEELLSRPGAHRLLTFVRRVAAASEHYRARVMEDSRKN
jgi:hypothetical protein